MASTRQAGTSALEVVVSSSSKIAFLSSVDEAWISLASWILLSPPLTTCRMALSDLHLLVTVLLDASPLLLLGWRT